ncbi:alpha-(1:3)-fucosyltransferase C-like protein, partial [Leptotrombidium deliense]
MLTNESVKPVSQASHPKPRTLNLTEPIILIWTTYFSGDWIKKGFAVDCLKNKCVATSDRVYLQYASSVLFHWRDISATDLPLMKRYNQKWVLYNMESPANTYWVRSTMENVQKEIDWTMTYRLDSDVYAPYGQVIESKVTNFSVIPLKNKKRQVAWFVSNCYTAGKREDYVKQLSKYIQVDIYGNC